MKKLLLVAFVYPPQTDVGVVRAAGLAKYLSRFGWECIVLTPRLPEARRSVGLVETGYRDVLSELKRRLRLDPAQGFHQQLGLPQSSTPGRLLPHSRLVDWLKSILAYPDMTKGWIPFALEAVRETARTQSIDAVLTTSPPITSHLIGLRIKRMLGIPWIADLRDLWIGPGTPWTALYLLQRRLEKVTLSQADALVSVSQPWTNYVAKRHPSRRVHCIMNGFDPDEFRGESAVTPFFSITYTGTLYQGMRDPTMLFRVLHRLIKNQVLSTTDTRVRFYGRAEPWLSDLVRRYDLTDVVEICGSVTRIEAVQRQRESQLLLLLGINIKTDSGCYPAKLFEYLAARRPILALGGLQGTTTELLKETNAGAHLFNESELCEFLTKKYAEFRACGVASYGGRAEVISKYTQEAMARNFSELLETITTPRFSESQVSKRDSPGNGVLVEN